MDSVLSLAVRSSKFEVPSSGAEGAWRRVPPQRAVSRILSAFATLRSLRRDDHSSRPGIADGLERPTRRPRTGRPLAPTHLRARRGAPPYLALLRAGFCLPSASRQTRCALTAPFHPYLLLQAVCFLCHFPSDCPDRELPGALPCGVRTFLPAFAPDGATARRSSSPLRRNSRS